MISFIAVVLTDYVVARYLFGAPWLSFVFLVVQAAGYFVYVYLKSEDRYLRFLPKLFIKLWHKDIQSQQDEIWQDLKKNLETTQQETLTEMQKKLEEHRSYDPERLELMAKELDQEFLMAEDVFKIAVQNQIKNLDDLIQAKSKIEFDFNEKIDALKNEFYGFILNRNDESGRDLKRMTNKLKEIAEP